MRRLSLWTCVGDIVDGGKPARHGRISSMKIEAHEDEKILALQEGPRPKDGLKPVVVNRLYHVNLYCKLEE